MEVDWTINDGDNDDDMDLKIDDFGDGRTEAEPLYAVVDGDVSCAPGSSLIMNEAFSTH